MKASRKRILSVALSFLVALMILMSSIPVSAIAEPVQIESTEGDLTEWRYKFEGGLLWRRLWNLSLGYWMTEWEPMY